MDSLRVAIVHDFDEEHLFGVRYYARRLREAIRPHCRVVDVHPTVRRIGRRNPLRSLVTLLVKEVLYPLEVRSWRADLFHVVDQSHAHLAGAVPGPAVVTCHDLISLRSPNPVRRFGFRRRLGGLRRAAKVVTVSRTVRDELVALVGIESSKIALVPNRVDPFFLENASEAEIDRILRAKGLGAEPFFLHVGNSLPYKNLGRIMGGLGGFGRGARVAPLLVKAGAPLTRAQRSRAKREGVRVQWLGEVEPGALRALYRRAEALVYPSLEEGFCWPVAEALAAGCPVVTSTGGALAEVAGEAALRVDPLDEDDVADALRRIREDPSLRSDLVARGLERGRSLTGDDLGENVLAVYREVLGR